MLMNTKKGKNLLAIPQRFCIFVATILKNHKIMDSTTISIFSQIFRGTGRNAINGQKKGGVKAHTVIMADEDVMAFMNITDAATSDQSLLNGLCAKLPGGSCVTFDMGYQVL